MSFDYTRLVDSRERVLTDLAALQKEIKRDSSAIYYIRIERDQEELWTLVHTKVNKDRYNDVCLRGHEKDLEQAQAFYGEVRYKIGCIAENPNLNQVVEGSLKTLKALYKNHQIHTTYEMRCYEKDILDCFSVA